MAGRHGVEIESDDHSDLGITLTVSEDVEVEIGTNTPRIIIGPQAPTGVEPPGPVVINPPDVDIPVVPNIPI